jgi:hypothetical protein
MLALLCMPSFISAQKGYDYAAFKFPHVKVKGLTGVFTLNRLKTSYNDYKISRFEYDVAGYYFKLSNSESQQKTDQISLNNYYYHATSRYSDFLLNVSKTQINRRYFDHNAKFLGLKQKFVELDHSLQANYNNRSESSSVIGEPDVHTNEKSLSLVLPAKIGFGRMEPTSDVFLAQFLMDDLLTAGLIPEKFSQEQLFELAQLMGSVRNQRVFDSRRANIYQMTELANWMEKNNIPQNIHTFNALADNWRSAFTANRKEGQRISAALIPWGRFRATNDDADTKSFGVGVSLEYDFSKSLNQYWQNNFGVTLSHDYQKNDELSIKNNITHLGLTYQYIFNPNSRTTYDIGTRAIVGISSASDLGYSLQLPLSVNYFINNRARIVATLTMLHHYNPESVLIHRPNVYDGFSDLNSIRVNLLDQRQNNIFGGVSLNYDFF